MKKLLPHLLLAVLVLAACGSDGGSDASSDTSTAAESSTTAADGEAKSHTEATAAELEEWQTDLNEVGCFAGAVDGTKGPQTEAAIKTFQTAEGLTVDGLLGPQTKSALSKAAADGRTVCTDTTGGESSQSGGSGETAELSSSGYGNTFTIGTCTSAAESSINVTGEVNGLSLSVKATDGKGTLAVSGGTETDGITLNGDVTSVTVGDAGDFTVSGTFTAPNNVGETFTLTGSCA
ncbi:MAG TPA: peptidoglycan-binding domain-containing protein [Ilumatobacteraceae bacterium]|nr:peptidoglycan-binding domain-containing protein [Ilumatobacteraceae bacterium]